MKSFVRVALVLSFLLAFSPIAQGRYIVVGDKSNYTNSWNEDYNYTQWMIDNPLYVGDIGVFVYPVNYHVVWQLPNQEDYDNCEYSNAIILAGPIDAPWPTGYFFTVTSEPVYLACGISGHCEMFQKVILNGSLGPLPTKLANSSAPGIYPYLPPGTSLTTASSPPPPLSPPPTLISDSSNTSPPPPPSPMASGATMVTSLSGNFFSLIVLALAIFSLVRSS